MYSSFVSTNSNLFYVALHRAHMCYFELQLSVLSLCIKSIINWDEVNNISK